MNRPNIIFIMTDDQGYGDLGCMCSDFCKTPNIDSLAWRQGIEDNWREKFAANYSTT